MRTTKKIGLLLLGLGALLIVACAPRVRPHGNHGLPPGQVKKVTGSKSARPYAPGQVKKNGAHKHPGKKRGHYKR